MPKKQHHSSPCNLSLSTRRQVAVVKLRKWNTLTRQRFSIREPQPAPTSRNIYRQRRRVILFVSIYSAVRVFSERKFRDMFSKRAELLSVYVHTSLLKYPRKIQPAKLPLLGGGGGGAPRYVLRLRHIATVKFIPQEGEAIFLKA